MDLHQRESQLCSCDGDGTITERRIVTSRERFTAVLGNRPRARILLEASTESEWVARYLESLGHEVLVADPNYAPMYATRSRRTKTDRRDARTLMDACRTGAYRLAHRLSEARRHIRAELAVRDALVRTRTRYVALAKALVRRDGLRVASSESHLVAQRIGALALSAALEAELQPLFAVLAPLNEQIADADTRIAALAATDPSAARLVTAPAVGPVTASAVVATIDDIGRFRSAHQFEAYLGLVPGERSSGEQRRIGPITKAGNSRVRWLLVEAAWRLLRSKSPEAAALRAWAQRVAVRRGKRIAVVALARRLAGILYAMWRDEMPYDARKIRVPRSAAPEVTARAG
ncbi:MAG TPA: IS110 family transposase [Candidatus Dormibacteraeota bacterium]|nr:IS110 family transposase [Candidatus Dormibacteraeota bacterium]